MLRTIIGGLIGFGVGLLFLAGWGVRDGFNLYADLPDHAPYELITLLLESKNVRIERIVSTGHGQFSFGTANPEHARRLPTYPWRCTSAKLEMFLLVPGRCAMRTNQ